jgi:hypothetical protein
MAAAAPEVTAPATPSPVPSIRRRLDADRILSLSAMAVGVCSLFITLYQTHLTRQAQGASVLPYLAFAVTSTNDGAYITLRNDGVGPARIEAFRILYKGRVRELDPYEFYLAEKPEAAATGNLAVDRVTPGRLLPAGATIQMLGGGTGLQPNPLLGDMLRLFALADVPQPWLVSLGAVGTEKAVLEIVYSSVYGDRWRLRSDQHVPQPM